MKGQATEAQDTIQALERLQDAAPFMLRVLKRAIQAHQDEEVDLGIMWSDSILNDVLDAVAKAEAGCPWCGRGKNGKDSRGECSYCA